MGKQGWLHSTERRVELLLGQSQPPLPALPWEERQGKAWEGHVLGRASGCPAMQGQGGQEAGLTGSLP